jgi:hypothetical protein
VAFLIALLLAGAALVIGSVAWPYLPVEGDPGFGILLVAAVMALFAGVVVTWHQMRRGRSAVASTIRGMGAGVLTLVLAMLPVVLFVVYCFSPLNPDAPCLR